MNEVTLGVGEVTSVPFSLVSASVEVFHVTPGGRIVRGGTDITDDENAMADCLVELLRVAHGIEIKRA